MRLPNLPDPSLPPAAPRPRFWLVVALVITLLLISALPGVSLESGGVPWNWSAGRWPPVVEIMQWLVLLTLPLYGALLLLFWPVWRTRRTVLALLLLGAVLLALGWWVRALAPTTTAVPTPRPPTAATPQPDLSPVVDMVATPLPGQTDRLPEPPAWVAFAFSLAVIGTFLVGLAGVGWLVWRSRLATPPPPLAALAQEAHSALAALQAGDAWENVIVRCYQEMVRLLEEERAIYRPAAMTPREFERRLTALGAPPEPVRELTRLFEAARYGQRRLGPEAEQQAQQSLRAIAAAYGSGRHEIG